MNEYQMNPARETHYHFVFSKRSTGEILLEGDCAGGNKQDCINHANSKARSIGIRPMSNPDVKLYMKRIDDSTKLSVLDIMSRYGLNRKGLSDRFDIPYATVQKWCFPVGNPNHRDCPEYIVNMIDEILSREH